MIVSTVCCCLNIAQCWAVFQSGFVVNTAAKRLRLQATVVSRRLRRSPVPSWRTCPVDFESHASRLPPSTRLMRPAEAATRRSFPQATRAISHSRWPRLRYEQECLVQAGHLGLEALRDDQARRVVRPAVDLQPGRQPLQAQLQVVVGSRLTEHDLILTAILLKCPVFACFFRQIRRLLLTTANMLSRSVLPGFQRFWVLVCFRYRYR